MSPLIHAEVGWLLAQPLARRRDRVLVTLAAVISDVDGLGLVVSDELYENWHHKLGHGVLAACVVAVVVGALTRRPLGLVLGALAFHAHLAMDLAGSGPGWPVLYWWPWSDVEWLPSWQWDLASWQNTVFGLSATVACLACALPYGRTPVELFSLRADARVVDALRARFGRRPSTSAASQGP